MFARFRKVRAALRKPAEARSLSEKLLISGTLTSIDYAVSLFFRIGATLIVTRLLSPEIFGLFAVIMTFQIIVVMITDFGVRSLIIVSENARDPDFLRTCWSVQAARGLGLYGAVLLLALGLYGLQQAGLVPAEIAYGAPVLPAALAINGFALVLQGLESVNQHVFAREMRFRRITILNITRSAATPVLTIAIAVFYPTIWALVAAGLLIGLLHLFLSFRLFPGPAMRLRWHKDHAAELWTRGKWIMSHSTLTAATNQADQLLLGAFLPAPVLGVYFLAKQIYGIPQALIRHLHGAFGLQVLREIVGLPDKATMRARYYRYRIPFDALACFAAGVILAAAPAVIDLMYDPRYLGAGTILQILALGLPLTGPGLIRDAYGAQKRFRIMAVFGLIQAVSIWAGLIVALMVFDNPWAAFVVVAVHRVPEIAVLLFMARREGWIDILREVRLFPAIGIGALAGWGLSTLYFGLAGGA